MTTPLVFRTCRPEHIRYIEPHSVQSIDAAMLASEEGAHVIANSHAISGWAGVTCIGACGIVDYWRGRAAAWALLSPKAAPYMMQITREVNRHLAAYPARRIEMFVRAEYEVGRKWARLLKFEEENGPGSGYRKAYFPDGGDAVEYVRTGRWLSQQ